MSCGRVNRQPTSLLKALERATRSLISKECLDRYSGGCVHHVVGVSPFEFPFFVWPRNCHFCLRS